jgi:hypothetical protein
MGPVLGTGLRYWTVYSGDMYIVQIVARTVGWEEGRDIVNISGSVGVKIKVNG